MRVNAKVRIVLQTVYNSHLKPKFHVRKKPKETRTHPRTQRRNGQMHATKHSEQNSRKIEEGEEEVELLTWIEGIFSALSIYVNDFTNKFRVQS